MNSPPELSGAPERQDREIRGMLDAIVERYGYDFRDYASDLSDGVLRAAREGVFALTHMKEYSENYLLAGGKTTLSDHYTAAYDKALFRKGLQRNVVFAQHNLVTDGSFNEFQVILCRN